MSKNFVQRNTSLVSRTFDYQNGDISLKFTLRIDVKKDLKIFKELLETALKDVTAEIESK